VATFGMAMEADDFQRGSVAFISQSGSIASALFSRAERRWPFAAAATLATSAYVLRYLVDPLLPKSVELMVGAVFYLALLGAINCWLFAWSRSLVPGLASAAIFFAAYRTLGVR